MIRTKVDASPLLLVLIGLLLLGGGLFAALSLRTNPVEEALSGDRVINVLFVIEKEGKPLCSYVFLYYPATRRAAIFDIPGELGLIIQRINRVDRIDTLYDPRRIAPFETEIEKLLELDISYSIVFTLENLGKIVDLIEGVEIFIPSTVEIYDGEEPILFPAGLIRLDGDKTRAYLTYEVPGEDPELARFHRQRFFLGFIMGLGEKNEFLKIPQISQFYFSFLKTGMNQHEQARLFDEFAGIDTDRVSIQSISGISRVVSGQTLLFPHYDGSLVKEIVRQTLGTLTRQLEGAVTERVFTLEVLNGTAVPGLAGRTAELLRGFGYDVISIGNADRNDYEYTEIVDRSGYEDIAKTLAEVIHCENIRYESPDSGDSESKFELNPQNYEYKADFTIILGRDFNGRYVNGRQ
jgi:anionic cell wall polymer biosynthesis LytR-Cps2A-Psr (LCP) family protein